MFQDNPLLSQLKQQLHASKPRVEGTIRANDKGFGFLECDKQSYFIAPPAMKNVLHGDKVKAILNQDGEKTQAEPESLIEPMLGRFIGKVRFNKQQKPQVVPDHPNIKRALSAVSTENVGELHENDWVVAQLINHPLRDNGGFKVKIERIICAADDKFAPWWVTLARHQQPREPVAGLDNYTLDDIPRQDLTALSFITIDAHSTQDMDDALYITPCENGWKLSIAVADPTAYIPEHSQIDQDARQRCFTNYLPGFIIPMLPAELSDERCSLRPHVQRPALVCEITLDNEGKMQSLPEFKAAWIESKAKLDYDDVSDYLENRDNAWQPANDIIATQLKQLHQFALTRINWRQEHALLFNERPDYVFELANDGEVKAIHAKHRRIAHKMVEECMILANTAAAHYLSQETKCGIFNVHNGFDKKFLSQAQDYLLDALTLSPESPEAERFSKENLTQLEHYRSMRQTLDRRNLYAAELRLRRFLQPTEFKIEIAPHFGLGLEGYATWTSPIRKYSDMVNHRIIKAHLQQQPITAPDEPLLQRLQEARRQNRLVERDIADWLYARFYAAQNNESAVHHAEVTDISRGGIRVQITDTGASVFIPMSNITADKTTVNVNNDEIALYINDQKCWQLGDKVNVEIIDVNLNTRSLVGKLYNKE
ncbi:exoribonuclease II [Pasteurellaceae bacterium HPA106]|uniref:exoribonuclease II n=1 Tax=Spirabiliibacterium pneumoniae TaxID=221400 RepID=UPI001AAE0D73|nr:exoribonuclease II [Spirabiliibacterium pneumoniae]MBE2895633.1 exoribonuclease II [Spirabiliibacterium pneumoniae]